jgi:tRNA(Ile)-lysidine synthase
VKSSTGSSGIVLSPLAQRAIEAFGFLVPAGSSLGVAVSGGSDSMALLTLAAEYRDAAGASLRAVTIDHGLRTEAKDEARFVGGVCEAIGVTHDIVAWERAAAGPVSQDEARRARHTMLAEWAMRHGVERIALGHTRDDRLETFLMRARQGSGWHGLAGPMPNSVSPVWPEGRLMPLIRPLLGFGRDELRTELMSRGANWVEDPSNDATRFERVRMRKLLARMSPSARTQALNVMDGLMRLRAAVTGEALALLKHLQASGPSGEMGIPLGMRAMTGAEAWIRFVETVVMAAGGGKRAPRRDGLDRLLSRIAASDPQLARGVTLAGARIWVRQDGFLCFGRALPRRAVRRLDRIGAPDWGRAGALLAVPDLRVLAV